MSGYEYLHIPPEMMGFQLLEDDLEEEVKLAALKASKHVVGLQSFIGDSMSRACSGIIIHCEKNFSTGSFVSTIITSASLVRHLDGSAPTPNVKIQVCLFNGMLCEGQIAVADFHYNLAIIKVDYDKPLQAAPFREICDPSPFFLHRHAQGVNLGHNDKVISLSRNHISGSLDVQPGLFSVQAISLDFEELRMTTCKTSEVFIGGPLINLNGEVLGLNFNYGGSTPFLPANIVSRFWESVKHGCDFRRPLHGMRVINLDAIEVGLLEKLFQDHPQVTGGVMVHEVKRRSPAEKAGICPGDIIIMCIGDAIKSSMEFSERMWDHTGESVEIGVIQSQGGEFKQLTMTIEDVGADTDRCSRLVGLNHHGDPFLLACVTRSLNHHGGQ